ncbi:AIR synthase related protein, partial [Methanomethylovorans sp.]
MLQENDFKLITEKMGREPNIVEQGCFLNLWSEHCSYRSSGPLLKTFTTTGEKVIIGPGDDAAIVDFEDGWVLAIGMESHNHPSYVDPHNGAATGVGGIVRDIISMGARPIALMDPLYFGPLNTPKNLYLFEHIIEGIASYGNCIGVPVVRGEAFFDETYSGNPLVNVACIGLARKENIVTAKAQKAGNKMILMGSTTGRDGLGGASFASRDLSESSEAEDRPSIQIGDPFTEKLLIEATLEVVGAGYVRSCRDLGAAGLAGA